MSEAWLGIDTSTPYLCLALWSPDEGLLSRTVERVERRHASRFVGALEETLQRAGVQRRAIGAIAVGNGPGSYTGLRVGGAAAKGLTFALGVPLSGCDTLAAVAYAGLDDSEEGLVALDARRGNAYLGRYRREGQEIITIAAPHKAPVAEARVQHPDLKFIEDAAPDPAYIARQAGSGLPYRPVYL